MESMPRSRRRGKAQGREERLMWDRTGEGKTVLQQLIATTSSINQSS
jgi:hypothetical protein